MEPRIIPNIHHSARVTASHISISIPKRSLGNQLRRFRLAFALRTPRDERNERFLGFRRNVNEHTTVLIEYHVTQSVKAFGNRGELMVCEVEPIELVAHKLLQHTRASESTCLQV